MFTGTRPSLHDFYFLSVYLTGGGSILALLLIFVLGGGAAVWYFKFRKPQAASKGDTDLDEFDFDDDDEEEAYAYGDDSADLEAADRSEEQEDKEE